MANVEWSVKFPASTITWDDCEDVVHKAWSTHRDATSALCDVKEKITRCGAYLYAWGAAKMTLETERIKVLQK